MTGFTGLSKTISKNVTAYIPCYNRSINLHACKGKGSALEMGYFLLTRLIQPTQKTARLISEVGTFEKGKNL